MANKETKHVNGVLKTTNKPGTYIEANRLWLMGQKVKVFRI